MNKIYRIGDTQKNILLCFFSFSISFGICVYARVKDLSAWDNPIWEINGEKILPYHDSYAWLAGAKGINQWIVHPLSLLIKYLNEFINIPPANIAFWLPLILAPLVVIPMCILAGWWKIPEAGIVSGALAGLSPKFLLRTRLGYYDTDLVILFFQICFAVGLIICLEFIVKKSRSKNFHNILPKVFFHAILLGILLKSFFFFHSSGKILIYCMIGFAGIVSLIYIKKINFYAVICAGLIMLLTSENNGWYGLACSIFITGSAWIYQTIYKKQSNLYIVSGILFVLFIIICEPFDTYSHIFSSMLRYTRSEIPEPIENSQIILPKTVESIQEAHLITNIPEVILSMSGNWIIFLIGITGLGICIWKRPFSIVFLPLLLVGIASFKFGNRFCMFGGAAIGFGIGFGTSMFVKRHVNFYITTLVIQLILCFFTVYSSLKYLDIVPMERFITKPFSNLLIETGKKAKPDAQLWVWWDYAYAVQYYSEKITFADGMRNGGCYLFLLARALMTPSPVFAHNMMIASVVKQLEMGPPNDLGSAIKRYPCPLKVMTQNKSPKEAMQLFIEMEKKSNIYLDTKIPEQYLIVSWDTLMVSYWISRFGTWDMTTGKGVGSKFYSFRYDNLNYKTGELNLGKARLKIKSIDFLTKTERKHFEWNNKTKWYGIINELNSFVILMDERLYNSLMVQMLIGNPDKFNPYFELITDSFPWARVYRLASKNISMTHHNPF